MFRLLRVASKARPVAAAQPMRMVATRTSAALGSHSHDHGHDAKPRGPYDPHHHHHHDEHSDGHHGGHHGPKDPGLPSWTLYAVYAVYAVVGGAIFWRMLEFNPIDEWARREALAREQVRLAGGVVEFGKYYHVEEKDEQVPTVHRKDVESSFVYDPSVGWFREAKNGASK